MNDSAGMTLEIFKDIVENSSKINTAHLQKVVGLTNPISSEKIESESDGNQEMALQREKEVSLQKNNVTVDSEEKSDIIPIQTIKNNSFDGKDIAVKTRLDIVQNLVDDVFSSFSLTSINTTFFGDLVSDLIPSGYVLQKIGVHTFFVKEEKDLNLPSIISFLDKIKQKLLSNSTISVPMVFKRNIEGSIIRSLVLSERELLEIMKIYPDYQFGYTDHTKQLDDIKLVIRIGDENIE